MAGQRAPLCFATLIFNDSEPSIARRSFDEDEAMFRLWAGRMLNTSQLPIHVMQVNVNESLFRRADPEGRLHVHRVHYLRGSFNGGLPWYKHMHTKLHAWHLPCVRVAMMDYDGIPLRSLDPIFSRCPERAELCATKDAVSPLARGAGSAAPCPPVPLFSPAIAGSSSLVEISWLLFFIGLLDLSARFARSRASISVFGS